MSKYLLLFCLFWGAPFIATSSENEFEFYPENQVLNFLQYSSHEKLNFIRNQKIEIYKYETGGEAAGDIASQNFLTLIPDVDRSRFSRFNDVFDTSVLGVFFSRHNSAYGVVKDTLLVSSEADMWTLAHELSHALIDKHRHRHGVINEELSFARLADAKEDYEESMRIYHNLGRFPDDAYTMRAFQSIKVWTTMQVNFLYTFELEEVKIERALGVMYREKVTKELSKVTYDRSGWYIEKNCHDAIGRVDLAKNVVDYFQSLASVEFLKKHSGEISTYAEFISQNQQFIHGFCKL